MKKIRTMVLVALAAVTMLSGCVELSVHDPEAVKNRKLGTYYLEGVYLGETDMTLMAATILQVNVDTLFIELREDGSFDADLGSVGKGTGTYALDGDALELTLELTLDESFSAEYGIDSKQTVDGNEVAVKKYKKRIKCTVDGDDIRFTAPLTGEYLGKDGTLVFRKHSE